jgi:hypothetical protein
MFRQPTNDPGPAMFLSQLFKHDKRCMACAVSHAHHIAPGAQGVHVAKIQYALMVLDGFHPDVQELRGMNYGRSTAAGVLAYKRKRRVINFSYQTTADNIVGIMTIRQMDREVWEDELRASSMPTRPFWMARR